MENREGILLSGAGRVESPAELSENERNFFGIVNYIMEGMDDLFKKYNVNKDKFRNSLIKSLVKTIKLFSEKKGVDVSFSEALKVFFDDRQNGLEVTTKQLFGQEISDRIYSKIENDIEIQKIFSNLGRNPLDVEEIIGNINDDFKDTTIN